MSEIITLNGLTRFRHRYEHNSGWLFPVANEAAIVPTYGGIVGLGLELGETPVIGSTVVVQDTRARYVFTAQLIVDGVNTIDGWQMLETGATASNCFAFGPVVPTAVMYNGKTIFETQIVHNLDTLYPDAEMTGLNGDYIECGTRIIDSNTIVLTFRTNEPIEGVISNPCAVAAIKNVGGGNTGTIIHPIVVGGVDYLIPPEQVGTAWTAILQIGYLGSDDCNVNVIVSNSSVTPFTDVEIIGNELVPYSAMIVSNNTHVALNTIAPNRVMRFISFI